MLVCFLCGIAIFFDDYANTLIVGGTFRPIMDKVFISREKLSFLVDATSAPVASISPISSWIGVASIFYLREYCAHVTVQVLLLCRSVGVEPVCLQSLFAIGYSWIGSRFFATLYTSGHGPCMITAYA
jgi:hypothetical protein